MSSPASGTDRSKKDPVKGEPEKGKKGKGKKEEEKKPQEVKKVSPIASFFSSMKVKFTIIIIFYTLLSIVVGCAFALFACLDLYEKTDVLSMKELVQSMVGGVQIASNAMIQRGGLGNKQLGNAFKGDFSVLNDTVKTEEILAKHVYQNMAPTTDGSGLYDWKFMPMNLFMVWDDNYTERLVYYRPCKDIKNRKQCELMPRESAFVDYEGGDYRMAHKDEVPTFFRQFKDKKPITCPAYGDCVGIADIPDEEGGPMMYFLSKVPFHVPVIPEPLRGWHILWASNMLFFTQIAANRTGLCIAGYSSTETNLPENEMKQYQKKKSSTKEYQLVDPHDSYYNNTVFSATFFQDTDEVTLAQEFYSTTRYSEDDREFCDDSYDHGPEHPRSKSYVYLAYRFFDYLKGNLTDEAFMIKLSYHNPISQRSFTPFHAAIVSTSTAWFLTVCILVIYFNVSFLVPLEKMRKMRSDLIKTSLAGLDDDGTLAKEIFGSMVDDNALIDANGDEIRVMLTLQDRLNDFYTGLIKTRSDELAHIKGYYMRRFNALKVMNYFMRREDGDLQKSLPGLLDSKEINRHFRRGGVAGNMAAGTFLRDLGNARHTFRQFKTILSNELAIEFFKCYCYQRGRSTLNSLFFVMDVSWLNQVEEGAKKGTDDFLSGLFTDTMSQSSNPPSAISSPRMTRNRPDGLVISTNSLSSLGDPELGSPRGEPNRPRHSHFAKSKETSDRKDSDADEAAKRKVPFAAARSPENSKKQASSSASSLPSEPDLPKLAQTGPTFVSASGESIAHFIHESYFGRKSLAQRDPKHSALLGCSQVPDYLALRDGGSNVMFSPIMFNTLLTTVVKKFGTDVIPQFLESTAFQLLVYCLNLTNYFTKSATKGKRQRALDDEVIAKPSNALVNGIWPACHVVKKQNDDEDDSSSDESDDGDDENADEAPKKKDDKGGESPLVKTKEGDDKQ